MLPELPVLQTGWQRGRIQGLTYFAIFICCKSVATTVEENIAVKIAVRWQLDRLGGWQNSEVVTPNECQPQGLNKNKNHHVGCCQTCFYTFKLDVRKFLRNRFSHDFSQKMKFLAVFGKICE